MVNLARPLWRRKELHRARHLLEQAVPYHQAALQPNPRKLAYRLYFRNNRWKLAALLLSLGEHAAAAETAALLVRAAVDPANDVYTAARCLAGCVPLAEHDNKKLTQSYADRAVSTLRQAMQNGYKNVAHMRKDNDLDPLRTHQEFQKLLKELEKQAKQDGK
jgi:hypothetical protein